LLPLESSLKTLKRALGKWKGLGIFGKEQKLEVEVRFKINVKYEMKERGFTPCLSNILMRILSTEGVE
jgi:hypothetical protein